MITDLDFVSIPTQDLDRALAFYEGVLGLERSSLWQRDGEEPMGAELLAGDETLSLIVTERLGITFSPSCVPIALRVDDVEASRTALEAAGVEFRGSIIDSGVCKMTGFSDPDGNALMIHRRYAPKND